MSIESLHRQSVEGFAATCEVVEKGQYWHVFSIVNDQVVGQYRILRKDAENKSAAIVEAYEWYIDGLAERELVELNSERKEIAIVDTFDEVCKRGMQQWEIEGFKRRYSTLYGCIMEFAKQITDKDSLLHYKQLAKHLGEDLQQCKATLQDKRRITREINATIFGKDREHNPSLVDVQKSVEDLVRKYGDLYAMLNRPEVEDFIQGVGVESAHQVMRWTAETEMSNPPHHYVMVVNKLLGKLCVAIWDRDREKFKHHAITIAAVMSNAHYQMKNSGSVSHRWFHPEEYKHKGD